MLDMLDHEHALEDAAEARVRDFAGDRNAPLSAGQPTPRELVALNRVYGERVKEARKLAGLNMADLSRRLGISIGRVAAIEAGRAGELPAWLLARVATITGCRMDYLAGLTEESELGEPDDFCELVMRMMLEADTERAMQLLELVRQRDHLNSMASDFMDAASKAQAALLRIEELNPEVWQDMRGGGALTSAVGSCLAAGRRAADHREFAQ